MTHDVVLLKRFKNLVLNQNKKLSLKFKNELMKCESLPKKILKGIEWYYKYNKSGGGYSPVTLVCIWGCTKKEEEESVFNISDTNLLGSGANGNVYSIDSDPVSVLKIVLIENEQYFQLGRDNLLAVFSQLSKSEKISLKPSIFKQILIRHPITAEIIENKEFNDILLVQGKPGIKNPQTAGILGYKMERLSSIMTIEYNYYIYMAVLFNSFKKIKEMHNSGIIHCDLKIQNFMINFDMSEINNITDTGTRIKEVIKVLDEQDILHIVDYDGSIVLNNDPKMSLINAYRNGNKVHCFTPLFTHPYIIHFILNATKIEESSLNMLQVINLLRKDDYESADNDVFDHQKFHNDLFKNLEYEQVFIDPNLTSLPNNNEQIIERIVEGLKYADYYTMAMSVYYTVLSEEKHVQRQQKFLEFVIKQLHKKARKLISLSSMSGGYKFKIPFLHPRNNSFSVPNSKCNDSASSFFSPTFYKNNPACTSKVNASLSKSHPASEIKDPYRVTMMIRNERRIIYLERPIYKTCMDDATNLTIDLDMSPYD